jgi:uncharacterized damage-inducible protein DinB
MSERVEKYIARMAEAREYLFAQLDQVKDHSEEQLYSDGASWTIRQLVIHLMISDKGIVNVMQGIVQGGNPIPEDYDLDRYNKRSVEKKAEVSIDEAMEALKTQREEFVVWLRSMDDSILELEGRHPDMQTRKLSQFLNIIAGHEKQHADDIAKHLNSN